MSSTAPRFRIVSAAAFERDTPFRMPFRFGVTTVRQTPQAFVTLQIEDTVSGARAEGWGAELMVPKWFDKNPDLTPDQTVDQLRRSVDTAVSSAARQGTPATAADHIWTLQAEQQSALSGENGLVQGFGPALVTRALLDALGNLETQSFYDLVRSNRIGLADSHLPADLEGLDLTGFLQDLKPGTDIALRHTVGLLDPLTAKDQTDPVNDGLPETLTQVIETYRPRYFKIKVSGDMDNDIRRLLGLADVLSAQPDYRVTLDGNEQYATPTEFAALLQEMQRQPGLEQFRQAILFIEQPIHRDHALDEDLGTLGQQVPLLVDESDMHLDSFLKARECGYRGVSSKACKGVFRSLLNHARTQHWTGGPYFMSAEDLTTQAGLGVQQDLALVSLLGLSHVERNGHHYVNGFAGATRVEQNAFAAAHPSLYRQGADGTLLDIRNGRLDLSSLKGAGFASGAQPESNTLRPLRRSAGS